MQQTTQDAYLHHWNALTSFMSDILHTKTELPINTHVVALFISHLYSKNLQYSTIRTYVSAISYVHKMTANTDPTTSFFIQKLLQGIKNQSQHFRSPLKPITKDMLHKLVDTIPFCTSSSYMQTLYKALFLLTFHACLRAGEVVYSNKSSNTLSVTQITPSGTNDNLKYHIQFHSYKHSNNAKPTITLNPSKHRDYCPVAALQEYLSKRKPISGPLFLTKTKQPLTRAKFSTFLKTCIDMAGFDSADYNTHSFRIGRATQLASENATERTIKSTGRWKSSAFQKYIRPTSFSLPK